MRLLIGTIVFFNVLWAPALAAEKTITWYQPDFPPYVILDPAESHLGIDNQIVRFMIDHLPDYEHRYTKATYSRIMEQMRMHQRSLSTAKETHSLWHSNTEHMRRGSHTLTRVQSSRKRRWRRCSLVSPIFSSRNTQMCCQGMGWHRRCCQFLSICLRFCVMLSEGTHRKEEVLIWKQ